MSHAGTTEPTTDARRRELAFPASRVFADGPGAHGYRRVAAELNRECHACSVGFVAELMRELGLPWKDDVVHRGLQDLTVPVH